MDAVYKIRHLILTLTKDKKDIRVLINYVHYVHNFTR
jgi:hypothetical protein